MKKQFGILLVMALIVFLVAIFLMVVDSSLRMFDDRKIQLNELHKTQLDNRKIECYQQAGMWINEKFYTKEGNLYDTVYRCVNSSSEREVPVNETNISVPSTTIPETSTLKSLGEPVTLKGE